MAPRRGAWDIPGGFVEAGERPEQAARREVKEETGVDVRLRRLLGIFPGVYGPGRAPTLNIYYIGHLKSGARTPVPKDDVAELAWFPLDRLPARIAFANNRRALAALCRLLHGGLVGRREQASPF